VIRKGLMSVAAGMTMGSTVLVAAPADAAGETSAAATMTWCNTVTCYSVDPSPGPCRNITRGAPHNYVANYTGQGQIVYSGYNCTGDRVTLSPTIGRYVVDGGAWRSYKHT